MLSVILKTIHITTVVISISLFTLRCIWMNNDSPMRRLRWVKITPHINDTILLVSALSLAASYGQYPFVHTWLTVKVVALLLYIGLGMVALRFGNSMRTRRLAWLGAYMVFAYIVWVAITKDPSGPLGLVL